MVGSSETPDVELARSPPRTGRRQPRHTRKGGKLMLQSTRDRTRHLLPLVMAVVGALIITACGGAPTPATTTPGTPATAAASATAKPPALNPPAVLTAGQIACSL